MLFFIIMAILATAGFLFYYKTQMTWVESAPYKRTSEASTRTLVVVYSRTGNSRYKQELIDKFSSLVRQKKGQYLGKLFVRRGRIYWQSLDILPLI